MFLHSGTANQPEFLHKPLDSLAVPVDTVPMQFHYDSTVAMPLIFSRQKKVQIRPYFGLFAPRQAAISPINSNGSGLL